MRHLASGCRAVVGNHLYSTERLQTSYGTCTIVRAGLGHDYVQTSLARVICAIENPIDCDGPRMFWRFACFEVGHFPNTISVVFVGWANVSAAYIVAHPHQEISQYLSLEWMSREEVGEVCARPRPVADGIYIHDRQVNLQKSLVVVECVPFFEASDLDFAGDHKGRAAGTPLNILICRAVGDVGVTA